MPDDFNPTEWITTAEAAELTGYHVKYVRRLVREGKAAGTSCQKPPVDTGGSVFHGTSSLVSFRGSRVYRQSG